MGTPGKRAEARSRTLGALLPDEFLLVETGTIRELGNWEGDGQSTIVWSTFAAAKAGAVITIDIDPIGAQLVGRLRLPHVIAYTNDSLTILPTLAGPVDLLYLDSFDVDFERPEPAANHHLAELHAAWHLLKPGSVVAVDDNLGASGKGIKVADRLLAEGATEIVSGYVRAWRLP
jgi:hypothetical protein